MATPRIARHRSVWLQTLSADLLDVSRWALIDAFPMAHVLHTLNASLVPAEKIDHTAQRNPQPPPAGVTPEGRKLDGRYMPWQAVGTLGDDELRGLLMALKEKQGAWRGVGTNLSVKDHLVPSRCPQKS
jgi:hypothetical protein